MRKLVLVLLGSLFYSVTFSQQPVFIPVVMRNHVGSGPFYPSQKATELIDPAGFQGIPDTLKAFTIKAFNLTPAKDKLFLLYGITKQDKRIVLFDVNFDRSFAGEQVFLIDYDGRYDPKRQKAVLDSLRPVKILFQNAPPIFVKPNVYNCCRIYNDSLETIWHLFVQTSYHRQGEFSVNGHPYKIAITGSYSPFFVSAYTKFFVLPEQQKFLPESDSNESYAFNSTASVNEHQFSLDSISRFGDTVWLRYKGYNAKAEGNRVGDYARSIRSKAMSKEAFDLQKLRGKYVLLDFWGTWCKPCIELIPRLSEVNEKYRNKGLVLVSVANDKKESYSTLMKRIKDHRMTWTNLFDDQDLKGSIANQYEVESFPTSILINPEGKIIFRSSGTVDFDVLEKKLAEIIQ